MANDVLKADVHRVLERHSFWYEVHPYYVLLEQRPVGSPIVYQRVQAGFDVDFLVSLDHMRLPRFLSEEAHTVLRYFEAVAREVESNVGQHCTVQVIPSRDLLVLDTHKHFQPEAMLRIRISHSRGLDQPEGPAEEQALQDIRDRVHELGIREA